MVSALPTIRRICLWGGPGAGKSTTAKWLASELPLHGYGDVEYVDEAVKKYARAKIPIDGVRQMITFGRQVEKEVEPLLDGVKLVVTDSPLALQAYYSKGRQESFWRGLYQQTSWIDAMFPAIHIFLNRGDIPYDPNGRYQTAQRASEIDKELREFAVSCGVELLNISTRDREALLALVKDKVK